MKKCKKSFVYLPKSSNLVVFDGKVSTQISIERVVDIERSFSADWDKFNFPHLSEVLTDVHVIQEIYAPLEIVKEPEAKVKVENLISEVIPWDKGFISSSYLYNFY